MTYKPFPPPFLPKAANVPRAEIYQSGARQHWHFHKCDLADDAAASRCAGPVRLVKKKKRSTISRRSICCCCCKCLLQFVQMKQCFTCETLQCTAAYLGQSKLNLCERLTHSSHFSPPSPPVENHSFCLEINTRFTAVPRDCALEYFWLGAAKVWTQPFIILSQGKQLASSLQTDSMGCRRGPRRHVLVLFLSGQNGQRSKH